MIQEITESAEKATNHGLKTVGEDREVDEAAEAMYPQRCRLN